MEQLNNSPEKISDVKLSLWNSAKVKTIGKRGAVAAPRVIFSVAFQASDWVQLLEPEMWEIKAQPLPEAMLSLRKIQSKKEKSHMGNVISEQGLTKEGRCWHKNEMQI